MIGKKHELPPKDIYNLCVVFAQIKLISAQKIIRQLFIQGKLFNEYILVYYSENFDNTLVYYV
jgi:hypothetical protein